MHSPSLLDNVSIVLVQTRTPANIGAAARCLKNMGLSTLHLVNPFREPDEDASKLAVGATDILDRAVVFDTLDQAIAGHGLVFGTSRHKGRLRKNITTPAAMAESSLPLLRGNRIAIVFGNEVTGLGRSELALCNEIIAIPASPSFPSLNLSQAVLIVAYELYQAAANHTLHSHGQLALSEELEHFYRQLKQTLHSSGFFQEKNDARMMATIRQIFGRARLSERDLAVLRGIFTSVSRRRQF